jgi:alpha-D-ribose 1-methylphosphonate 5-triphosphate synthase subunit PhnH
MRLDPVHDLQGVFRALMAAMSSPGSIHDIAPFAGKIDISSPIPGPMLAIAMTLLDAETSFCLRYPCAEFAESAVSRITSARPAAVGEADFILAVEDDRGLADAIREARVGTLVDPHRGATLVALSDRLSAGGRLRLSGPGVASVAFIDAGLGDAWMEARAVKNREYPLGIDMLIVDRSGRVAALPRTTQVSAEG